MKKLFIMCGCILTFTLFIVSANADTKVNSIVDVEYQEYLERNWKMVELSTKLQKRLMDYYHIEKQFEDKYPEYYGGIYISDDARSLVLQIVKENIPQEGTEDYKIYEELTTMDDAIEIEYVDNTFNELNDVNNMVGEYLQTKINNSANIVSAYIDIMNNKVIVELLDNSKLAQEKVIQEALELQEDSNYKTKKNLVTFESGKEKILHKNLNAGGEYFGRVGECSTGFRTRVNGQVGFVTAGHCVKSAKTGYIAENLGVGTVVLSTLQFDAGQKYDYVFVATNSSNTPTNILQYSSGNIRSLTVVNYCPIITVNMEIAKSGITTGYTSGKVKGLNEKIKVKDDNKETIGYIYGLVKTSAKCDSGDSGAVVFIPRTDANGGSIPIGILSGGDPGTFGFINPQMFFTDISDMPSEFVMGRY